MTILEPPRSRALRGRAPSIDPPPPFDVEIRPDRDRVIVVPKGELDLATVDRLGTSVDGLIDAGFDTIVLDLRELTFLDAAGAHLIVDESRRQEVSILVIDGGEPVAHVFDVCGVRRWLSLVEPGDLRRRG